MTVMAPTVPPCIPPGPTPSTNPLAVAPLFPADAVGTAVQFARRVRVRPGPGAVAMARAEVAAAIQAWGVAVDPDVAILLTSELVTNAITHGEPRDGDDASAGPGGPAAGVILAITGCATGLRVDVHDGSARLPVVALASAQDERGRGLLLVTSLSADWGCYPTPSGKAVYFTLDAQEQAG
jgi:hypothetical protein